MNTIENHADHVVIETLLQHLITQTLISHHDPDEFMSSIKEHLKNHDQLTHEESQNRAQQTLGWIAGPAYNVAKARRENKPDAKS